MAWCTLGRTQCDFCEQFAAESITAGHACMLMEAGVQHQADMLATECMEYILHHGDSVLTQMQACPAVMLHPLGRERQSPAQAAVCASAHTHSA